MASQTIQQSQSRRRIAVLDIETVSLDPTDPRGALDAKSGRIVCIGMLFDDGHTLTAAPIADLDEKKLLERFWASITEKDILVGHSILGFDLLVIRQRSWLHQVQPAFNINMKKYYTEQVVDIMEVWSNWQPSRYKGDRDLDSIAQFFGVGEKNGHGSDVAALWANHEYVKLMDYAQNDCWLAYQIWCRMNYREPLGAPMPVFARPAQPAQRQRELVPLLAARSLPHTPQPESKPVYTVPPAAALAPAPARRSYKRGSRGSRVKQIQYAEFGGALILGGSTFPIKDSLSDMGGRWDGKVWQVPAAALPQLSTVCAQSGIVLSDASGGAA